MVINCLREYHGPGGGADVRKTTIIQAHEKACLRVRLRGSMPARRKIAGFTTTTQSPQ